MSDLPNTAKAVAAVGGQWAQGYQLNQYKGGPPIDLTGLVFEFVIRPSTADSTTPAKVQLSSAASTAQGSVVVTPLTGSVYVTVTRTGTLALGKGTWAYALWSSPGQDSAIPWLTGTFVTEPVAQP